MGSVVVVELSVEEVDVVSTGAGMVVVVAVSVVVAAVEVATAPETGDPVIWFRSKNVPSL
jgi:hypothetical protein